ncbi:CDP-glycerol glycerophosphotransferase [Arthrobacter sp. S41]|nr:CDP-glycerol glycerophosphotransferase [Arthrobacter sp. S41]
MRFVDGSLKLKGRIDSRHSKVVKAKVLLVGRTSGYVAEMDTKLGYLKQQTERDFGHYHFIVESEYDLESDIEVLKNDILDFYLEMDIPGEEQTVRRRFGKTRFLERRNNDAFQLESEEKVISFVPYFTYQAKNPSIQVEVFDRKSFVHLAKEAKYRWIKPKNVKPIWLIGEMPYKAQDNGLTFFKYMQDNHPEIESYYVISSDSPERQNLDGYKNVIDYRSVEHIDITLRAEKIISTHAPSQLYPTKNPDFVRRVAATKVFLQHGVTAGKWIAPVFGKNANDFDADLVMVCSEREKEFFVHDLGYKSEEVAVTGFARFDNLFAEDVIERKNQMFVMPTWRPWLQDPSTFEESDYFMRWMSLLAGDRLSALVNEFGLEVIFCLHPNMQQYTHLFKGSGARVVFQGDVNVQDLIKQSGIMLTDYSSAALDFAFLHKPVVYYQFDAERFPVPHADPLSELPGPVVTTEREVIERIRETYSAGGVMTSEYMNRADRFIANRDRNSSARIYRAIKEFAPASLNKFKMNHDLAETSKRYFKRHRSYSRISQAFYRLIRVTAPLNENVIVFESTLARSFGGNPKAIYDELVRRGDARLKVVVSNRHVRVRDENTIVVKRHSFAFLWYLATAKYWVNDQNFPHYITRRRGGVYVQTWHGTPLKKMFLDQANFFGRDPGYVSRVTKMAAQWNRLVSPNAHTSKSMRSSYGYKGEIFELGYPRNDVLSSPDRDVIADGIRQRLGISKDKYVVLYAPTFRDDKPTKRGRFAFDWPFTPSSFHEALGDDVVLLVRTHNLVSNKVRIPDEIASNVIDVSQYPDIQELFLASDMLITDYSSSFFDYAILDRPVLFFAYDLENYRDSLRGFYLDYEKDLPGPIFEESEDLFDEIQRQVQSPKSSGNVPAEFIELYASFDDGFAASRVVDQLLTD